MITQLISSYFDFLKDTKKESIFAIITGIIGAITETIAIYYLSAIIRNLEYLKIINKDLNKPKKANFTKTPLKKIEKLVEASTCALGSQP